MILRTLLTLSLIALLGVVLGFASADAAGRRVRKVQIAVKDEAGANRLAGAIKIADVNRELQKQGLKTATFTKKPAVLALASRLQIQ